VLTPATVWVGRDRFRGLGHLLTEHHLVASEPRVSRHRNLLLRRGIIGWRIEQSFFQRRADLVTLVATTAAGEKEYAIVDLHEDRATALADEAVPGLVAQFLR
jgi:putative membrane protein